MIAQTQRRSSSPSEKFSAIVRRFRPRRSGMRRSVFDLQFVPVESRRSYRMACLLFWSILLTFFFLQNVISVGIVTDRSMLPLLSDGEYVLINRYMYHFAHPRRGDIIVLHRRVIDPERYVKRVIGLEGEMLFIRSGSVYINGHRLEEPYVMGKTFPNLGPIWLHQGQYFVMGDNRIESLDSRYFGLVTLHDIEGRITPGELFSFF